MKEPEHKRQMIDGLSQTCQRLDEANRKIDELEGIPKERDDKVAEASRDQLRIDVEGATA